jgi:hypothetical protein
MSNIEIVARRDSAARTSFVVVRDEVVLIDVHGSLAKKACLPRLRFQPLLEVFPLVLG